MKKNVYVCDICGKEIDKYNGFKRILHPRIKYLEQDNWDGAWYSTKMDLCENCWCEFRKFVKEKNNLKK